jgi:hypothetical protein
VTTEALGHPVQPTGGEKVAALHHVAPLLPPEIQLYVDEDEMSDR